jgi:tRNA(Ile2) C34 agmatinyltransferase TiaS
MKQNSKDGNLNYKEGAGSVSPACNHDYESPVRHGRADYRCRLCGQDITLELYLMAEADVEEEKLNGLGKV